MAPLAPPLTRPLVLSKAKHCQAVLSKTISAWNFPNKFFMKFSWQKKKIRLMLSQTTILCPGWNHETAIRWRSKILVTNLFQRTCSQTANQIWRRVKEPYNLLGLSILLCEQIFPPLLFCVILASNIWDVSPDVSLEVGPDLSSLHTILQ